MTRRRRVDRLAAVADNRRPAREARRWTNRTPRPIAGIEPTRVRDERVCAGSRSAGVSTGLLRSSPSARARSGAVVAHPGEGESHAAARTLLPVATAARASRCLRRAPSLDAGLAGWERAHLLLGGQLGHTENDAARPFEMPAVRVVAHAWRLTGGSSVHPGRWHYVSDVRELSLLRHAGECSARVQPRGSGGCAPAPTRPDPAGGFGIVGLPRESQNRPAHLSNTTHEPSRTTPVTASSRSRTTRSAAATDGQPRLRQPQRPGGVDG